MRKYSLIIFILASFWTNVVRGQLVLPKGWSAASADSSEIVQQRFKGRSSFRFELNREDTMINNGKRSEISTTAEAMNVERWYLFDIYLPNTYKPDSTPEILAQWHAIPDWDKHETWRSPPIALQMQDGHWGLSLLWAQNEVNTNKTVSGRDYADLGGYKMNRWTSWKFHIRFSYKDDGILEVWKNGASVFKRIGPNYYNDEKGPYFKFGIYKWSWNKLKAAAVYKVKRRILYFHDVQILKKEPNFN